MASVRPEVATSASLRPKVVVVRPHSASVRPNLASVRPNVASLRKSLASARPNFVSVRPWWPRFDQVLAAGGLTGTQLRQFSIEGLSPGRGSNSGAKVARKLAPTWATRARYWTNMGAVGADVCEGAMLRILRRFGEPARDPQDRRSCKSLTWWHKVPCEAEPLAKT